MILHGLAVLVELQSKCSKVHVTFMFPTYNRALISGSTGSKEDWKNILLNPCGAVILVVLTF